MNAKLVLKQFFELALQIKVEPIAEPKRYSYKIYDFETKKSVAENCGLPISSFFWLYFVTFSLPNATEHCINCFIPYLNGYTSRNPVGDSNNPTEPT